MVRRVVCLLEEKHSATVEPTACKASTRAAFPTPSSGTDSQTAHACIDRPTVRLTSASSHNAGESVPPGAPLSQRGRGRGSSIGSWAGYCALLKSSAPHHQRRSWFSWSSQAASAAHYRAFTSLGLERAAVTFVRLRCSHEQGVTFGCLLKPCSHLPDPALACNHCLSHHYNQNSNTQASIGNILHKLHCLLAQ